MRIFSPTALLYYLNFQLNKGLDFVPKKNHLKFRQSPHFSWPASFIFGINTPYTMKYKKYMCSFSPFLFGDQHDFMRKIVSYIFSFNSIILVVCRGLRQIHNFTGA